MSNDIVLGRGEVFFDRFQPNTETPIGLERFIGNCPSFGLQVETQELEHYKSTRGLRVKDASVTLQINVTGTIVTDEIKKDNIAMFFLGSKSTVSVAALTAQADRFVVQAGGFAQLGMSASNPAGVGNVSNVTVTLNPDGTPTTLTLNTDYKVDTEQGYVEFLDSGNYTDGAVVEVRYDVGAHSYSQVISGTDLIYGAIRFRAYNGVGPQTNFYLPKCAIRPNGEYNLIGDDWQQFGFNLEVLQKGNNAHIYADGRPFNIT